MYGISSFIYRELRVPGTMYWACWEKHPKEKPHGSQFHIVWDTACRPGRSGPMPTATGATAGSAPASAGGAKKKGDKKGTKAPFSVTARREMKIDYLGEQTPGPGSYLPASTFGKYTKGSGMGSKKPSSAFKSGSAQRARTLNEHVPGPGAHSPNHISTERNKVTSSFGPPHVPAHHSAACVALCMFGMLHACVTSTHKYPHTVSRRVKQTNPGSPMKSAAQRFGGAGRLEARKTAAEPGPGAYDSQEYGTIKAYLAKKRERMSRQNPGFGASTPAHTLPYEEDIHNDQKPFVNLAASPGGEGQSFNYGGANGGGRGGTGVADLSA